MINFSSMIKWRPAPVYLLIACNTMLLFFSLLDNHLTVPVWLQVTGRLHPMILHFPIVLIVAYALSVWFMPRLSDELLLWSAFAAVITALAGVFLSKESTYEGSGIQWHKWMGTGTSLILLFLYLSGNPKRWLAILPLATVIIAGHLGGDLTHGEGYVLAPLKPSIRQTPPFDQALVYTDVVQPVLSIRCMQCHNGSTTKGGLDMSDPHRFAKGGRNGKPWDTTAAGPGLLLERIHLPPDDRKHMPPANKTQLSDQEQKILYAWIKDGSPFDTKVVDLDPTDTLRIIASSLLRTDDNETFDFPAADEKKIAKLRTNYRAITPLANGSPALAVDFYGAGFFRSVQLKELSPVKEQIVSVNLDKMPVTDNDLSELATFPNLRQLNLDFTKITSSGIPHLTRLSHLQTLSLTGTATKAADLEKLAAITSLRKIYIWKTGIPDNALASIRQHKKDLEIIAGFNGDTVRIRLNPPRLETEARIIRDSALVIKMRHFVPGATIRYTLDGSDPDSAGRLYTSPFPIADAGQFRAKAYKPGWLPSDATTATFYSQKFPPDSIRLLLPVDSNYLKYRPTVLIDADKGDLGFNSGKWLGFHKNGLSALLYYRHPVTIKSLTLSSLVDIGSYIFPPTHLRVWGGPDEHHLKPLAALTPHQPDTLAPSTLTSYPLTFPPTTIRCLKIVADNVKNLPPWHPGKGKPAWIFFDELLVN
ncbi:MAG: chitobiase/beta-hexosaminidase C-terminal domain-containing protein [Bacteroidetes bacterium]|nr:chitobiase/beta-hexosaminidase C-terminal domain-containing protein [Bacteroidota bacterium]